MVTTHEYQMIRQRTNCLNASHHELLVTELHIYDGNVNEISPKRLQ